MSRPTSSAPPPCSRRSVPLMNLKALLIVLCGLLVAVLVAVVVVANVLIRQEEQRAYENCMARAGFAADEVPDYEDPEEYMQGIVEAAERCGG